MIHIKIPSFDYGKEVVLRNIDLPFEEGTTHGLVGLNGAGKSTLLNLIAGFLTHPVCKITRKEQAMLRREIAYIDSDLFFYPKLTAREFLNVFPARQANYQEEKLAELFKLPLDGFMEEFSTGMKKKLLILSQLKQDKDIYIFDEPFNGLDMETNKLLEMIVGVLNERGKTVFISSHILDPLLTVCGSIYLVKDQTIFRSYSESEFHLIEEELFGNYKRTLQSDLRQIL